MSGDVRGPAEEEYYPEDDYEEWSEEEYAAYEEQSASVARARSRRRKALITVAALLLALFFAFWWAWSYYTAGAGGRSPARPTTGASCQPDSPTAVAPSKITVNVYNATTRAGLAAATANDLRSKGFVVATVSNDPQKKAIPGTVELRYSPAGQASADVLVQMTGQGTTTAPDARPDSSVDVVLGDTFTALGAVPKTVLPICAAPSGPASGSPAAPAASPTP